MIMLWERVGDNQFRVKMKCTDAISQQGLNGLLQLPPQGVKCFRDQCEKVTQLSDIIITFIMFLTAMFSLIVSVVSASNTI